MKLKPLEKLLLYLVSLLIHLISLPIFLELNLVLGVLFCFAIKVMVCLKEISLVGGTEISGDIIAHSSHLYQQWAVWHRRSRRR